MKKWYVDFAGYCEIDAASKEEATEKFWARVNEDKPLPSNIYEVWDVEEKEV